MIKSPVLCLCNYGQVRSITMAEVLKSRGYIALAAGMFTTDPRPNNMFEWLLSACETVIICNQPNVERRFKPDISEDHANMIFHLLDKYNEKVIVCDTVGFDRWGQPMHPELIERCELFLDSLTWQNISDPYNAELDIIKIEKLEEIRAKYKKKEEKTNDDTIISKRLTAKESVEYCVEELSKAANATLKTGE